MELINLDIRELMFWFKQAQKKTLQDQLRRIQAARLAMADATDYKRIVSQLETQLHELDVGKHETIRRNWEELRMLKR